MIHDISPGGGTDALGKNLEAGVELEAAKPCELY